MIEPVGVEAVELLGSLHARAFPFAWTASEIAKLMDNAAVFALLSCNRDPDGFAMAWAAAGDAEILTVAVVPEARRRGVGRALVEALSAAAFVRGAASMHLEVAEDNLAGRALYLKLGFSETGRRHAYYARENGSADAIVMRRPLHGNSG